MIVEFRCKQSGNTVKFSDPNDIELMRKEVDYEEVTDAASKGTDVEAPKRGRPRRTADAMEIS